MVAHRGHIAVLCATLTAIAPTSLLAPSPAWAQPAAAADAAYKQHMQNGVKLYQERNWSGALAEFEAAYRAKPKASPLVNIALCQKAQFQYPKAIATLERALSAHADSLDGADATAARDAVAELRSLLGYVRLTLVPPEATVRVDGEPLPAGAAKQPIPLGPGSHTFSATAPGYAPGEQSVSISSGDKDKPVELRLVANQGYLTVVASSPRNAIAVDQKYVATGRWSGLLDPGPHTVQIYLPGSTTAGVGQQVVIGAGKLHEVKESDAAMAPLVAGPPGYGADGPTSPPEPIPDLRGFYALAQGGGFGLLGQLTGDFGLSVGVRAGLRVATPIGIEGLLQLDQTTGVSTGYGERLDSDSYETGADADLRAIRIGGNLRLMSRGRVARFVGALGGGISIDSLDYESTCQFNETGEDCFNEDNTGVNGFVNTEFGMEIDVRGVFFGFVLQQMVATVSSLKGPDIGKFNGSVGFGLRVGYGTW